MINGACIQGWERDTAVWFLTALMLFVLPTPAGSDCLNQAQLKGVNLAGAEFGNRLPGERFKDYAYPVRADLEYFREAGMSIIRLPFRWERIQHQLMGPLDEAELRELRQVIAWARELDLCTILDLHNYGRYGKNTIGSEEVPEAAFVDVWQRLATALGGPEHVMLGLMNEPVAVPVEAWPGIAQRTLLALRAGGVTNYILVPASRWSGAHEWGKKRLTTPSPAELFSTFSDPMNRYAIELHQYADADYSGTKTDCIETERLRQVMNRIAELANPHGPRFFLGEFGVADNPACLEALQTLLEATQNDTVWLGWTYWAAGRRWGKYPFSIQPRPEGVPGQMLLLQKFLPKR